MKKNRLFIGVVVLLAGLILYSVIRISGQEMGVSGEQGDWIVRLAGVVMLVGVALFGFGLGKKLSGKK